MGELESLDHHEPLERHVRRHAYDRLIMLSDGVFAIVITLAALEIRAPAVIPASTRMLFEMLLPTLIPYAISFAVTAAYWAGHRRMISRLMHVDGGATLLSLCFLGLVALQPSAVQLLSLHGGARSAVTLYYLLIICTGLVQFLLWLYAAFVADLVHPSMDRRHRLLLLVSSITIPLGSTLLAFFLRRQALGTNSTLLLVALCIGLPIAMRIIRRRLGIR